MLICQFIDNSPVMEVTQVTMSFSKTHVEYWYYDTQNWTRSLLGKKNDRPTQPMTDKEIEWAKQYYLPKAQTMAWMAKNQPCRTEAVAA